MSAWYCSPVACFSLHLTVELPVLLFVNGVDGFLHFLAKLSFRRCFRFDSEVLYRTRGNLLPSPACVGKLVLSHIKLAHDFILQLQAAVLNEYLGFQ